MLKIHNTRIQGRIFPGHQGNIKEANINTYLIELRHALGFQPLEGTEEEKGEKSHSSMGEECRRKGDWD